VLYPSYAESLIQFVQKILTNSPTHPHGIKVRLSSGEVGRVKEYVK